MQEFFGADFGEEVPLPSDYNGFWQVYQRFVSKNGLLQHPKDLEYFNRRVAEFLPEGYLVQVGYKDKLVLTAHASEVIPVIPCTITIEVPPRDDGYGRWDGPVLVDREVMLAIASELRMVLQPQQILKHRRLSPRLESGIYSIIPTKSVNLGLMGVLFDLYNDYHAKERKPGAMVVAGKELLSTPSDYPVEKEIANLYQKVGSDHFARLAKGYFELQDLVSRVRAIDENSGATLEAAVSRRHTYAKQFLLAHLNDISLLDDEC